MNREQHYRPEEFFGMDEPQKAFWIHRYKEHQEKQQQLGEQLQL